MGKRNSGEFGEENLLRRTVDEWDPGLVVETAEKIANSAKRSSVLTGLIRIKGRVLIAGFSFREDQNGAGKVYPSLFLQPGSEFF